MSEQMNTSPDGMDIEEELQILEESVRPPKTLSADNFMRPIDDMCRRQTLVTLPATAKVSAVIASMQEHRIGALLIVEGGKLAGIVTERDLMMKVLGSGTDPSKLAVSAIMTPNPTSLRREDQIAFLLNAMHVGGFRHVPIVDDEGRPTNVISIRDVLAFIVADFPAEVINLRSEPFRGPPAEYGG